MNKDNTQKEDDDNAATVVVETAKTDEIDV
jgi:hypothetical protein